MRRRASSRRRRRLWLAVALAVEASALKLRGYPFGGKLIVRCREGHLFATIWIPGVSIKALRLGWWRYQYCPVGKHWSLVTPVREADLGEDERRAAREHADLRLP